MNVMLAKNFESYHNPTGWWMSEKLDGVRALWTGERLLSRNGNPFAAPWWFTAGLPKGLWLDGELYLGRGKFQQTPGIVRKAKPVDAEWARLCFHVFDAPKTPGSFEQRLVVCQGALRANTEARVVGQVACQGADHLAAYAAGLVAEGAEGVMLRRFGSAYEEGRSNALLKVKPTATAEAEVVGYDAGATRGRLGSLSCTWRGKRFSVGAGLTDALRESPPQRGARITIQFQGLTDGGAPRCPVFLAVRDYE